MTKKLIEYTVSIPIAGYEIWDVEAENPEEAERKALASDGSIRETEYSRDERMDIEVKE